MPYPTIDSLKDYPILQSIEKLRKKYSKDKELDKALSLLLEALAVESSGRYGGGYGYMEHSLRTAQEYINSPEGKR